jgi:hypothetical protein
MKHIYLHAGEIRGYMMVQSLIAEALQRFSHEEEDFDSSPTDSVVKK